MKSILPSTCDRTQARTCESESESERKRLGGWGERGGGVEVGGGRRERGRERN